MTDAQFDEIKRLLEVIAMRLADIEAAIEAAEERR